MTRAADVLSQMEEHFVAARGLALALKTMAEPDTDIPTEAVYAVTASLDEQLVALKDKWRVALSMARREPVP